MGRKPKPGRSQKGNVEQIATGESPSFFRAGSFLRLQLGAHLISDSTTSYGSYSGAVPNEKITWGKLGQKTPKFIVESDATIVAPLIFSWVLGK